MTSVAVQVAQRSCIGSRSRNEDCVAVENLGNYWCFILSDGAGGHGNGEVAAQLVVDRVRAGFRSRPPVDARDLSELLLDAHDAVVAGQRQMGTISTKFAMHATVVVLMIDTSAGVAFWGHVGDSRLYSWRNGKLNGVTRDDSVLQSILDTGLVSTADLNKIPNRGVLLAALGSAEEAVPHVCGPSELQATDAFLLCSDGWWGGLDPQNITGSLAAAGGPEDWLDRMVNATREQADPRQDNYSAIACWIVKTDSVSPQKSPVDDETIAPRSRYGQAHPQP